MLNTTENAESTYFLIPNADHIYFTGTFAAKIYVNPTIWD